MANDASLKQLGKRGAFHAANRASELICEPMIAMRASARIIGRQGVYQFAPLIEASINPRLKSLRRRCAGQRRNGTGDQVPNLVEQLVPPRGQTAGEKTVPVLGALWCFASRSRFSNVDCVLLNGITVRIASPGTDWRAVAAWHGDHGEYAAPRSGDMMHGAVKGWVGIVLDDAIDMILPIAVERGWPAIGLDDTGLDLGEADEDEAVYTTVRPLEAKAESSNSQSARQSRAVLGRSAATGHFVLMPASKTGSVSIRAAKTTVKTVTSKK